MKYLLDKRKLMKECSFKHFLSLKDLEYYFIEVDGIFLIAYMRNNQLIFFAVSKDKKKLQTLDDSYISGYISDPSDPYEKLRVSISKLLSCEISEIYVLHTLTLKNFDNFSNTMKLFLINNVDLYNEISGVK